MKNIVFMMDIDLAGEGRYASSRRLPYKYSIKSWEKWCEKNDCELFVLTDLLLPKEQMAISHWSPCKLLLLVKDHPNLWDCVCVFLRSWQVDYCS